MRKFKCKKCGSSFYIKKSKDDKWDFFDKRFRESFDYATKIEFKRMRKLKMCIYCIFDFN